MERKSNSVARKPTMIFSPDFITYLNPNRYFGLPYAFYILIGGRGIGKTTGIDWHCAMDWIKNDSEFVYVRRYKTELSKSKDILDKFFPGVTTRGIGKGGFEYVWNGKRIGFGVTLAVQSTFKSGVDFSKVKTMVYDEAILKRDGNLRYLSDEITELFELISTVFRDRTGYRVFIMGNNMDIFNPYFEYFGVPNFDTQYIDKERGLYCEKCPDKEAFMKKQRETPLYKLTKGTAYGKYHYENEVLVTEGGNISNKGDDDAFFFRLVYNDKTINFYFHGEHELFAELRDKAIVDKYSFVIMENDNPNYYFIREFRNGDMGKYVKAKFYKKEIVCDTDKCYTVLKLIMEELK